jgi:hypothetical protein
MDQREMVADNLDALRSVVQSTLLETWTCLPGIVQSYDPATCTAVVQVAVMMQTLKVNLSPSPNNPQTTQVPITMNPIANVPVIFLSGGSSLLECEPAKDDDCLLFFASRNIDGWWSKGGVQPQPMPRSHSLSDAFAIVGPWSKPSVFTSLGPGIRMRTVDGTAYIEVLPSGAINAISPVEVTITVGGLTMLITAVAGVVTITTGASIIAMDPAGSIAITAPLGVTINGVPV